MRPGRVWMIFLLKNRRWMTKVYNGHDNFSFPFSVFFFLSLSSLCIFFWLVPLEGFCSGSFLPNDTFNSYLCFFVA